MSLFEDFMIDGSVARLSGKFNPFVIFKYVSAVRIFHPPFSL